MKAKNYFNFIALALLIFCQHSLSALHSPVNNITYSVDPLWWTARQSGTDNWAQLFNTDSSIDIIPISFNWNAGVRVGIGCPLYYDCWDAQLDYTWFRTTGSNNISTPDGSIPSSFIGNFYIDNADGKNLGPAYRKAGIHWTILMNMIDLELGRKFFFCDGLLLRPFIGLKGGWIHQTIHSTWENPIVADPASFGVATENLKNDFFGIGPSIGIDTKWDFYHCQNDSFNLFGDFSGALMYGHWSFSDVYKNHVPEKVAIDIADVNGAATMVRSFVGIGWETSFCDGRYTALFRLGYEVQYWMDQLQFYSLNTGRFGNPLTLQGGTFDLQFAF